MPSHLVAGYSIDIRDIRTRDWKHNYCADNVCYAITKKTLWDCSESLVWLEKLKETPESKGKVSKCGWTISSLTNEGWSELWREKRPRVVFFMPKVPKTAWKLCRTVAIYRHKWDIIFLARRLTYTTVNGDRWSKVLSQRWKDCSCSFLLISWVGH